MSKTIRNTLFPLVIALLALPVAAQEGPFEFQSDHYRIVSEVSTSHAEETADKMEALIALYNHHFRLPLDELRSPLRVRVFASKVQFEDYLHRLIGTTRNGFVYLHYGDPGKNELIGYVGDEDSLEASIIHQGFIQYLRAFVSNPPLWLREGFAVYFEGTRFDSDFGAVVFRENLGWLETLQSLLRGEAGHDPIPLDRMLSISLEEARERVDVFYPQAWGMVSFLINAEDPEINRILWDSLSALSPTASTEQNAQNVYNRAFRWVDRRSLVEDFHEYTMSLRTFQGWIEDAVAAFETGDLADAERGFLQAANLRDDHHVPFYFLGLINYEQENFTLADYYYRNALDRGAEEPVTLYALGVNAYADNRFDDARRYLAGTVDLDPAYRDRAESILVRIRDW